MAKPQIFRTSELFWLLPFVCLGLSSLVPLRAPPVFSPPGVSREVVDAADARVAVPLPVQVVMSYGPAGFLETSHAPETIAAAGAALFRTRFATGLMSRIYPGVLANDALWNDDDETVESILAHDPGGTYFGGGDDVETLRQVGLAALRSAWHPKTRDAYVLSNTIITNAALGHPDAGKAFYAGYERGFADLKEDLQPGPTLERPRVLNMGSKLDDWRFLWVSGPEATRFEQEEEKVWDRNASDGYMAKGRQQDAERVLMMDPDMIFLTSETPAEFLHEPRWSGLKAVRNHRVYEGARDLRDSMVGGTGLDLGPIWARWKAEVVHPERLPPKVRNLLAEHFAQAYGYTLSDDVIDNLLRIDENRDSAGYSRFLKTDPTRH
jgi:ABC-type Fe3+-hydroxamate transport system substrate-binding protein